MHMQAKIRLMTQEDIDAVLMVENASFPTPWSRSAFVSELGNVGFSRYYVAEKDSQIVGYAGMWIILDEAHITNIAVHPHWRGQKIGEALLCRILEDAVLASCIGVTLEVRISNDIAQNLYQKYGFTAEGLRKGYYTDNNEDAVIMWKRFRPQGGKKHLSRE
jgi:ribosomal-protein-alanine N-acetyltransferase